MINLGADIDEKDSPINNDMKWKIQVKSFGNNLQKLQEDINDIYKHFHSIKGRSGSYDMLQSLIKRLTESCDKINRNMEELVKLLPNKEDGKFVVKNNEKKKLLTQYELKLKTIQTLSKEIQKEMEKQSTVRKSRISQKSNDFSIHLSRDGKPSNNNYGSFDEITILEDQEIQKAIEEQQQCEKLLRDVITLEDIMTKLCGMVEEQGEKVEQVHNYVAEAIVNVEDGIVQLSEAVVYKEKTLHKKLCIISIVIIILIIIGVIIGLIVYLKT